MVDTFKLFAMFSRVLGLHSQQFSRGSAQKAILSQKFQSGIRQKLLEDGPNLASKGNRHFSSYSNKRLKQWKTNFKENITKIYKLFTSQCNVVMTQRLYRLQQAMIFYRTLYGERMVARLIDRLSAILVQNCRNKPFCVLLSATLFSWQTNNITNEDCDRCVDDMESVSKLVKEAKNNGNKNLPDGWEAIINKPHLKVWRKPVGTTHLYEYRVYGTFSDIPPRAFYNIQIDLEFWQSWEKMALDINVVEKHKETGSEIVHWLTKFPYPMYSREYLYVRRYKEDPRRNVMVVSAKAIEHPDFPITEEYVRVKEYLSQMVIKPHTTFDENGFDYILTYFDDPQSAFPSFCYNWLASSGVPEFVENLHKAAQMMDEKMRKGYKPKYIAGGLDKNQNNATPVSQYV